MIAIDAYEIGLEDLANIHVRRWLELAFSRCSTCSLEELVALTHDHAGHDADATLAEQWDLWETCLEYAGTQLHTTCK